MEKDIVAETEAAKAAAAAAAEAAEMVLPSDLGLSSEEASSAPEVVEEAAPSIIKEMDETFSLEILRYRDISNYTDIRNMPIFS